jgi:transposase
LLQRVDAGEPLDQVCAELNVDIDEKRLAALQAKYKAGGETWEALLDGRFGHPHTAHSELREWLYERKKQDESLRARELAKEIEKKFGVALSIGHINYLLRKRELTAPPGRPYKNPPTEQKEEQPPTTTESLDNAGIFFPGSSQGRDGSSPDG